ncbi:MAG TPA: amino acid adenylation domain-containing protein [Gemmatimonadaceae bacterium]
MLDLSRLPAAATFVPLDGVANGDIAASHGESSGAHEQVGPDDMAYMIYTSGSTGRPKGALNTHRGIVNRLCWMQEEYGLTAADVVLQKTPFSFDVSVWEFFWPLITGATLVLARPGGHRDPSYLAEVITRRGVTVCHFVPAMLRAFLDALPASSLARVGTLLRDVMASGEALAPDLATSFYRALGTDGHVRLHNLYGPTECAVDVTYWPCPPSVELPPAVPIGRPVANTRVYVLDPRGARVPIGVPGELFLAGVQVGAGYHGRAELTAERFVPDPYAPEEEWRADGSQPSMYRTGDLGRWNGDGTLEYLGRLDFQVKLRGFRIELGEIEATLTQHDTVAAAVVVAREDGREKRLVAYYTTAENDVPDSGTLRTHLLERLPEYMVPSTFVRLDALPISPSGKIDRKALPAPTEIDGEGRSEYVAPRTEIESTLAQLWAEVLRLERVGVHDNFFELGGDSILSIQIAARARAQELPVSVSMLGRYPSVAELAAALEPMQKSKAVENAPSVGTAPLTPIQRWFFELDPAEHDHWNQTFLFRTAAPLDRGALRAALEALVQHHDALRLRFSEVGGRWQQRYAASVGEVPLWEEDLPGVADDALTDVIGPITERAARSLDIAQGPCLRAVHMSLGPGRGARLLLVVHHLVVDGISWRILLEDLETAYGQAVRGERIALPPKTTGFQKWAAHLTEQANGTALLAERPYWRAVTEPPVLTLPTDGQRDASNTVGESETMVVRLDAAETMELLQRVPSTYATQVNDVLLLALADALGEWAGAGALLIDLEGHGRETEGTDLDLTRTIGWFTSVFPVRLDTEQRGEIGERLKAMKEQLRSVPQRGVGFGSLRYLTRDDAIVRASSPEMVFNYLGQFDQLVAGSALFSFASEPEGSWLSPAGRRRYLLDVNALVLNGQLEFRWTFGRKLHDETTIKRLADSVLRALREIIAHCRLPGVGGRTPSDFPLVALSQRQVDRLAGDGRQVEEIAPLVPMQSLFVATSAGEAEVGFEQWRFEVEGPLDVDAFRRAWQLMARRHEILRATFHTEGLAAPVQVIARQGEIPLAAYDWRGVAPAEQSRRLRGLLDADRAAGVRIDHAPLVRLALVRTGESAWTLVWSNHHLLLDRWSWPIVLREVGAAYEAIRNGRAVELPPAPAWRHYVRWVAERDLRESEAFWQRELAGAQPRPVTRLAGAGGTAGEVRIELSVAETAALGRAAREHGVTINTLASLAWGLWLARATAGSDVVFGLSVAGRPEEVRGIERLVGMCINNVPVRMPVDVEMPVTALLTRLDAAQRGANEHAYCALTDLQQWSGLPWHQRLFDTLLVFQHHGADDESASWLDAPNHVRMVVDELRTNYPLALVVGGRERMSLRLAYQGRASGPEGAERALAQLREILVALPTRCDSPARDILDLVPVYDGAGASTLERVRVAPRDDAEWVVARIWAEVLGCPVGVEDNFFDLGGQSLVATQIMSRVQEGLRMELPVSLLFAHPTVASFVLAVRGREPASGRVDRIAAIIRRVEDMTDQELRAAGVHD